MSNSSVEKEILRIKNSGLFDENWYLEKYPDVSLINMEPIEHYVKYGFMLNRDPNPSFSTEFYYDSYPKLKVNKINPFSHFIIKKNFKPASKFILCSSYRISESKGYAYGISLAKKYLPDDLKYSVNILKANQALDIGLMNDWLFYLNQYLRALDTLPITLKGNGGIIDRLSSSKLEDIDSGPLVTVIIAAWNAEDTILSAVNSILNQTWRNLEVIIVDDQSSDNTWAIMESIKGRDNRVKIYRNIKNVGPYVSRNVALSFSSGDYITVHDADDWAHPQRIEKQVKYLESTSKVACLSGMLRISNEGKLVSINKVGLNTIDGACRAAFVSLMVRGQFFKDVLGYWDNVRFGGDSELIRRIEAVTKRSIDKINSVTMFCLDNPTGLTNNDRYGYSEKMGVSPVRIKYKESFTEWHNSISKINSRLNIIHSPRKFEIPEEATNTIDIVKEVIHSHGIMGSLVEKEIKCDVCIITNLNFPGGNTSSTLDEVNYFINLGYKVKLIHCPTNKVIGNDISSRYTEYTELIENWSSLVRIDCDYLIVRHPLVINSSSFNYLIDKIYAKKSFFVINNSSYRIDGTKVYDMLELTDRISMLNTTNVTICPISSVIRDEVYPDLKNNKLSHLLSYSDWNPTFNLSEYDLPAKKVIKKPFSIGRHGRDGKEKWIENINELSKVYPVNHPDFNIKILGGARHAIDLIGECPDNWDIKPFGLISPKEYLQELDVFVYFPNTNLSEAFGRTIVEAMFASVPCVLPERFKEVFGNLAFYSSPENVCDVIYRLSQDDGQRIQYLTEVKNIALSKYSSSIIPKRLSINCGDNVGSNLMISEILLRYKNWIENGK